MPASQDIGQQMLIRLFFFLRMGGLSPAIKGTFVLIQGGGRGEERKHCFSGINHVWEKQMGHIYSCKKMLEGCDSFHLTLQHSSL